MTYYANRPSQLSLANGTVATDLNTGGAAGATLNPVVAGGGTVTYQSGRWRFTRGAASSTARLSLTLEPSVRYSVGATFDLPGPITAESRILMLMNGASTYAAIVTISTAGVLRVHNSANQIVYQTSAIPLGQFRVHLGVEYADSSGTNGKIRFNAYVGANAQGTTADYTFSSDAMSTGMSLMTHYWVGHANSGGTSQDMFLVSLQANSTTISPLAPLQSGAPSAQATVSPQSYAFVDARSSGSGGGTLSYAISPSAGVTQLAAGWWAVPRAVSASTYTITVTDGTSSQQDQTTVTVAAESSPTAPDYTGYTQTLVRNSGNWV